MSSAKATRKLNFFINEQAGDVYDAPVAGDVVSRVASGYISQATPELVARDNLKASFTPDADLVGIKTGTFTGVSEMYGAEYTDGTTKPWFNALFRSVQLIETKVTAIPVSSIGTQFAHNEIVTGDTSSAVGRVVVPTKTGNSVIYIVLTSGTFQAEDLTGSISGDATATGVDVDAGWSFQFDSTQCIRLSCRAEEDGQKSELFNAVPTITITADDSGIPNINWEIAGVINEVTDVSQWLRDATDTVVTRDTQVPPLWQCGRFRYINDTVNFSPVVDSTFTLDLAIERPFIRNANSCIGVEGAQVTNRTPIISARIDRPDNTDADIMEDWFDSNDVALETRFGNEVLNTFWVFAPTTKLENVAMADQDGFSKLELQHKLTGQDDAELEIVCI